jgi:plasmid stability protein
MPNLYLRNVPTDVYVALRKRASRNRRSISAEVIDLLKQFVPTAKELARRREFFERAMRIRSHPPLGPGPSAEEMLREDRER